MTPVTTLACRPAAAVAARRFACRLLACAIAAVPLVAVLGCDDHDQAKALDVQARANAIRASGGTPDSDLLGKLDSIAKGTTADAGTIQAKRTFGQLKLDEARGLAAKLAATQTQADALIYRVAGLADQARLDVALANNYRQLDPKPAVDALKGYAAAARGDGNVAKFLDTADTSIPTLGVAQQAKSKLDGEIAKLQGEQAELTKQRDVQLAAAGDFSSKGDLATGQARVDVVKQAADARQKAAEFSRQAADVDSKLMRLNADSAVQAALVTQLGGAAEGLDAQAKTLETGWSQVTGKAGGLSELGKQTMQGAGDNTVKALAGQLADVLKSIDDQAAAVDATYKEAIAAFDGASKLSGTLVQNIASAKSAAGGTVYEQKAWDAEAKLFAADRTNLDKGLAELDRASFLAGRATFAGHLAGTAKNVEQVGQTLKVAAPAPFESKKANADLTEAVKAADEAFGESETTFEGIQASDPDLASLKVLHQTGKILGKYGHAQLAIFAKSMGVTPDVAERSTQLLKDAKEAAIEAKSNGLVLPTLPSEIAAPAAAPTTAPAAEGATPPAAAEGVTPAAAAGAEAPAAP